MGSGDMPDTGRDIAAFLLTIALGFACIHYWPNLSRLATSFSREGNSAAVPAVQPHGAFLAEASSLVVRNVQGEPGLAALMNKMRVNYVRIYAYDDGTLFMVVLQNRTDRELTAIAEHPLVSDDWQRGKTSWWQDQGSMISLRDVLSRTLSRPAYRMRGLPL